MAVSSALQCPKCAEKVPEDKIQYRELCWVRNANTTRDRRAAEVLEIRTSFENDARSVELHLRKHLNYASFLCTQYQEFRFTRPLLIAHQKFRHPSLNLKIEEKLVPAMEQELAQLLATAMGFSEKYLVKQQPQIGNEPLKQQSLVKDNSLLLEKKSIHTKHQLAVTDYSAVNQKGHKSLKPVDKGHKSVKPVDKGQRSVKEQPLAHGSSVVKHQNQGKNDSLLQKKSQAGCKSPTKQQSVVQENLLGLNGMFLLKPKHMVETVRNSPMNKPPNVKDDFLAKKPNAVKDNTPMNKKSAAKDHSAVKNKLVAKKQPLVKSNLLVKQVAIKGIPLPTKKKTTNVIKAAVKDNLPDKRPTAGKRRCSNTDLTKLSPPLKQAVTSISTVGSLSKTSIPHVPATQCLPITPKSEGQTTSYEGEWPVAYHGCDIDAALSIIQEGFKRDKCIRHMFGRGILPDPYIAEGFADDKPKWTYNGDTYIVLVQMRVRARDILTIIGHVCRKTGPNTGCLRRRTLHQKVLGRIDFDEVDCIFVCPSSQLRLFSDKK